MAIERALISVYDKTGVAEFARKLARWGSRCVHGRDGETAARRGNSRARRSGIDGLAGNARRAGENVASEGARRNLISARQGRRRKQITEHSIVPIDLVVVNLYPFSATAAKPGVTPEELIENIDIGGPAMIRSAAKNFQSVGVIADPGGRCGGGRGVAREARADLGDAAGAGAESIRADVTVRRRDRHGNRAPRGQRQSDDRAARKVAGADSRGARTQAIDALGENPHQAAAMYIAAGRPAAGLAGAKQLQGKGLPTTTWWTSMPRGRWRARFKRPAIAIIKHNNPCGAAEQESLREAYLKAYECDPVSAYGGVLAFNRAIDAATAEEVAKLFVECIVAPGYEPAALEKFAAKKNLRLLEMPRETMSPELSSNRSGRHAGAGGRRARTQEAELKVATKRAPTDAELRALLFAWKVAKHVKSNAILFAREGQTVGVGAGQMSRVDSVKIAVIKAATAKLLSRAAWSHPTRSFRLPTASKKRGRPARRR